MSNATGRFNLRTDDKDSLRRLGLYGLASLITIVMVYPMLWLFISSLKPASEMFQSPPHFLTLNFTLTNYYHVIFETEYPQYFLNSLGVALLTTIVTTLTATPAGYALSRLDFRGKSQFNLFSMALYTIPPITLVIPLFIVFRSVNLTNTLFGVAIGHIVYALPFSLWLIWAFFDSIPHTYEEAAVCEGASRFQAVPKCVLPLAAPGIATIAIFSFTVSWNDYLFAYTIISSTSKRTVTLATAAYAGSSGAEWALVIVISALIAVPPFLAIVFVKDYLLEGFGMAAG